MGICFIGKKKKFHDFIEEYIEPKDGNFIDVETGAVVGKHTGTHHWTRGQRCSIKGKHIAYFISDIQPDTQDIIVAPGTDHPALFRESLETSQVHWIQGPPKMLNSDGSFEAQFRFQHKHPLIHCSAVPSCYGGYHLSLDRPLRALTPGQYAVFYKDNVCLGSARILKVGETLFDMSVTDRVVFPNEFS